jgi:hypothetical protein
MVRVAKGDIGSAISKPVRLSQNLFGISRPVSATRLGATRRAGEDGSGSSQSDIQSIYETFGLKYRKRFPFFPNTIHLRSGYNIARAFRITMKQIIQRIDRHRSYHVSYPRGIFDIVIHI